MDFIFLMCALGVIVIAKLISTAYHDYVLRNALKDIPSVKSYLLIDLILRLTKKWTSERLQHYLTYINQFKDGIFVEWIKNKPTIHIFKPEFLEIILTSTVNIDKGVYYNMFKPWLGNGLLISTGTKWFHDRKLLGPAFHFNALEQFAVVVSEKVEISIKNLEKEVEKNLQGVIDICPFLDNVTLNIIYEAATGVNVHAQEEASKYISSLHRNTVLVFQRFFQPWYMWDWLYYLTPAGREYKSVTNILHEFTKEMIRKKKNTRQLQNSKSRNEEIDKGMRKRTFLDLLLDLNEKENATFSNDEIREQVDTLMFAGHDTTSLAITWTLFCLGNHLDYQEKIHDEIEEVFQDSEEVTDAKKVLKLKYLNRAIKESLRLFPSVPYFSRRLVQDVTFGHYTIPKGCTIVLSIILMHRHPEIWPDPLKFDPDRFLPENSKDRSPYAYVPFSAGPRNCLGQRFGQLVLKIVLTGILRKWRIKCVKMVDTFQYDGAILLRPCEKLLLHFAAKK